MFFSLGRDAAYALRTFARNPGFTAAVAVSIALGIAANTTVFSMLNTFLLGELPIPEPQRMVVFAGNASLPYPDFVDYRHQTGKVFKGVAAYFPVVPVGMSGTGEPERVWGQFTSGNYFDVLGIRPVLGRAFLPEEDQSPGRNPVVILSHGLWRRRFASDPSIAGRTVMMNNQPYTVIGVAPAGFHGTTRGILSDFWVPLAMHAQLMPDFAKGGLTTSRGTNWLVIIARLEQGVDAPQAAAAVNVIQTRIDAEHQKAKPPRRPITIGPAGGLFDRADGKVLSLMTILMAVAALVLLISCANVANLMLARAAARQREIGIRMAVGAGRGRLVRQLLTESMLLSIAGTAGGLLLTFAATRALTQLRLPLPIPIVFDFTPDLRVLAFTAALAVVTGLVFGLVPALRATRTDLVTAFKGGSSSGPRGFGLRDGLVVLQVALSLVLLVGAGLFLRSLGSAASIDTGIRSENVLFMALDPKLHGYSPERSRHFFGQLRRRVEALPGVESMSYVDVVPLSIGASSTGFTADTPAGSKRANADIYSVGSRYFETMGIELVRGRDFLPGRDGEGVAVINQNLARRLFGDEDPIGRRVRSGNGAFEIIGLVRNTKSRTLGEDPKSCAFHYLDANPDKAMSLFGVSLAVKTAGEARLLAGPVRAQVRSLDRHIAVFNIETMREHMDKALLLPRLCAALLGVFGLVGLVLATVGLYGVMSYSVRRRTREIGIRMALGASSQGVLRMVARRGLALAAGGAAVGLAAALALSRVLGAFLYGISAIDPATFVAVTALLMLVASMAALLPARRAARVDPNTILRYE